MTDHEFGFRTRALHAGGHPTRRQARARYPFIKQQVSFLKIQGRRDTFACKSMEIFILESVIQRSQLSKKELHPLKADWAP